MKNSNWKDTAELIGIAALVASLVFVGIQIQQSQTIALAETNTAGTGNWSQRLDSINAHADVWYRGASGQKLQGADEIVFSNLVATYSTEVFMNWTRLVQLGEEEIAELLRQDFVAFLHQNPGAKQKWIAQQDTLVGYRRRLGSNLNFDASWRSPIVADLEVLDTPVGTSN